MKNVLGLFAKWPAAGAVKTRLAAIGGAEWAARVADAFLRDALERLTTITARRVLVFAPDEARAEFAALARNDFTLLPQGEGDLGQRLSGFLTYELEEGSEAIVVVGTDSPTLPVEYVERAFVELERADVVLGPACDGGYYLLGCRRVVPPVFEGIAWGGSRVLADTIAALGNPPSPYPLPPEGGEGKLIEPAPPAGRGGNPIEPSPPLEEGGKPIEPSPPRGGEGRVRGRSWRLAVLPPWYDVDTPDDWAMLCGHLAALRRAGIDPGVPHTEALTRECHS